jgi:S-adenosylmethionine/arginine decarboxylase-like enzyme
MKHYMLDGYGVLAKLPLQQADFVNETLNRILFELGLKPISPAFLLPYDYGLVPLDDGLSSFVFLQGGHATIHTFPLRSVYFVDIFTPTTLDKDRADAVFQQFLPFNPSISRSFSVVRNEPITNEAFEPNDVFGPHVLARFNPKRLLSLEEANRFLEGLIRDIGMTPITRSFSMLDRYQNPNYLSSIVMIAESHLSIHQDVKTFDVWFDIFSCKMFDYASTAQLIEKHFGPLQYFSTIARGQKHDERSTRLTTNKSLDLDTKKALNQWKNNL